MTISRSILKIAASMSVLSAALALSGSIVMPQTAAAQGAARVANPTVTGPIAAHGPLGSAAHDYPWGATMHNLAAVGYVEEEYCFEGTATRFNTPNGQPATVADSGHKYKTRMLVRRPKDAKKFNGTVLAEWTNVTPGYDLDAMWGSSFEHIIRGGYAWVGISAQRVGLQQPPNGAKLWSPIRYASIDVTEGGKYNQDELSYDIYAQGMQALKSPQGINPLGNLHPQRLIAMGASQSAGRLGTYINSLHGQLGGPVDAYILSIGGARIRDDIPVPVFKVLSETDIPGQIPQRQPDTDKYRLWEVPGASHSGQRTGYNSGALNRRDGVTREAAVCTYPMWPRVPISFVLGSSYDLTNKWVKDKTPPPIAPRAEFTTREAPPPAAAPAGAPGGRGGAPAGAAAAGGRGGAGGAPAGAAGGRGGGGGGGRGGGTINELTRDARGNTLGGIRLSEFQVATSLSSRENTGNSFCNLYGRYEPFTDEVINQLYPTHAAYVTAVKAQNAANLKSGFIQAADARRSDHRAETSYIGSGAPCKAACRLAQDLGDMTYIYMGELKEVERMGDAAAAITRQIARTDGSKGKPADRDRAKAMVAKYLTDLHALKAKGTITETVDKELTTGANAVATALGA